MLFATCCPSGVVCLLESRSFLAFIPWCPTSHSYISCHLTSHSYISCHPTSHSYISCHLTSHSYISHVISQLTLIYLMSSHNSLLYLMSSLSSAPHCFDCLGHPWCAVPSVPTSRSGDVRAAPVRPMPTRHWCQAPLRCPRPHWVQPLPGEALCGAVALGGELPVLHRCLQGEAAGAAGVQQHPRPGVRVRARLPPGGGVLCAPHSVPAWQWSRSPGWVCLTVSLLSPTVLSRCMPLSNSCRAICAHFSPFPDSFPVCLCKKKN